METDFLELMSDTITIEPPSGTYTDRGQPNYGAAVSYACRIEPARGEHIIRGPSGEERKAAWHLYVSTTTALNAEGRLTLPSGFNPQQPPFYSVGRRADEEGVHHYELWV